ncbi:ABC transporter permease [Thalassobacillus pellis]|uniref:ABC transporter permease n=1 Tax=Thalassobacillus pellis TaxID=748008 RepID=UPI00196038FF|nr:ABC transporter permease [Thalassobacillus pellis]MBM7551183.1 hypothetical protein [Thalassobacillus pellis]
MQGISLFLLEIRAVAKRPLLLFICMSSPFILLGLIGYSAAGFISGENGKIRTAIVDYDNTFETKSLLSQLQEDESLDEQLAILPMSSEEAEASLNSHEVAGVIIIPRGFTADLRNGTNTPIEVRLNQDYPMEASMIHLLLDSGAAYISAAQSGVNTAYELAIEPMNETGNNQQLLQQVIVTFTLAALDRNELFSKETVERGALIGWEEHADIAWWLVGSWLAISLFIFSRQSLFFDGVGERLLSMNIMYSKIFLVQVFVILLFTFSCNEAYFFIITMKSEELSVGGLSFHLMLLIHAVLQGVFAACCMTLTSGKGRAALWHLFWCLPLLLTSGILIPAIYLPGWIGRSIGFLPWSHFYRWFENPSYTYILVPVGWGTLLLIAGWLTARKRVVHDGNSA